MPFTYSVKLFPNSDPPRAVLSIGGDMTEEEVEKVLEGYVPVSMWQWEKADY